MPIQLGGQPQPDFDQPLELMKDCHRRIERFLDVLLKVVQGRQGGALDPEHRQALETALNYFRSAAPRHTEDEEQSLFPRLRRSPDPQVQQALARIDALEADHVTAQQAHERVDALGRRWLAEDALPQPQVDELRRLLHDLRRTYAGHIQVEDEEIFVLATRTLGQSDLTAIGEEMKQRRRGHERPGHGPSDPVR